MSLNKPRGESVIDYELTNFLQTIMLKYLLESNTDSITARSGGGQASATKLVGELSRITVATATSAPFDSVALPPSQSGLTLIICNHSNNPIQVFGDNTAADLIDDVATATGVTQMGNSLVIYSCYTAGNWYTNGLASGFVRGYSLQTFSASTIAANVGGTQGTGTPVTNMLHNVTAAGASYSITLPASTVGMEITIHNVSTQTILVFPNAGGTGTEQINALAANAAISMLTNTSTVFTCTTAGFWFTVPRVPS
jgi:hypothetical protein